MAQLFMGNSLWHLVLQSDAMSKGVLLLLLIASIISWALFFYKLIVFWQQKKDLARTQAALQNTQNFEDLAAVGYRLNNTLGGHLINTNLMFLKSLLDNSKKQGSIGIDGQERELLREHAYQIVDEHMVQEESSLPLLGAIAGVSPLLGLFGTVWGLIHAFIRIAEKQSADIATVAPGIAEALITTLAGLMVAIPALVMLVYLNTRAKDIEQRCISLSERFVTLVHRFTHQ